MSTRPRVFAVGGAVGAVGSLVLLKSGNILNLTYGVMKGQLTSTSLLHTLNIPFYITSH